MADAKKVRITLVKSPIGYNKKQKATVRALGLLKMQASREIAMTPVIEGMINKVSHLVSVEDIAD
ncbi:MAG: 50S ribosomal protein L30 [Anaerolineae bacterium]|nr:50S ribosomal protein L30 [Anaerolineae bacterium]MDQ7036431.1 50S ribosomal protein L30 [Anaerolineae bacterium]